MKKKNAFSYLYNINPDTKAYLIEVSLDHYTEIFNGWDASPLRRRDMEPELLDYIEQAGYEIPLKEQVELCFYIPKEIKNEDRENKSIAGIKNNFQIVLFFIQKLLYKYYRQALTYIVLAILFLLAAYLLRDASAEYLLFSILIEGLFVGGWFLLWGAFSIFFFDSFETRKRRKVFRRFADSPIYFKRK
ncbi:MAG: hypothetical protein PHP41_00530 [Bacilli bacterium]|jgi:hypothetical protein|nr:hypothetical protein [Bacilli bacterium]MDY0064593.1 hypothetical protein [Bacilli bacterium]